MEVNRKNRFAKFYFSKEEKSGMKLINILTDTMLNYND